MEKIYCLAQDMCGTPYEWRNLLIGMLVIMIFVGVSLFLIEKSEAKNKH